MGEVGVGGFWWALGLLLEGLKCHLVVLLQTEAPSSESGAVWTLRLDRTLSRLGETPFFLPAEMTEGREEKSRIRAVGATF